MFLCLTLSFWWETCSFSGAVTLPGIVHRDWYLEVLALNGAPSLNAQSSSGSAGGKTGMSDTTTLVIPYLSWHKTR